MHLITKTLDGTPFVRRQRPLTSNGMAEDGKAKVIERS